MGNQSDETYKVCPNCNKVIEWESKICPNCGLPCTEVQFQELRGGLKHPILSSKNAQTTIYKRPLSIVLVILLGILFLFTLLIFAISHLSLLAIIICFPIFIIITFSLIFVNLRKNKNRTLSFLISTCALIAILIISSVSFSNIQGKKVFLETIKNNILVDNATNSYTAATTVETTGITVETTAATTSVNSLEQQLQKLQQQSAATTKQTSVTALLNLLSYTGNRSNGFITVQGQVENISSDKLENVEAIVSYCDKDNNFIKYDVAVIQYNPIMPGQISPFKVIGIDNPLIVRCRMDFQFIFGGKIETIDSRHK